MDVAAGGQGTSNSGAACRPTWGSGSRAPSHPTLPAAALKPPLPTANGLHLCLAAEGWLFVVAVIDLFSRRMVGWSMSAGMIAPRLTSSHVVAQELDAA